LSKWVKLTDLKQDYHSKRELMVTAIQNHLAHSSAAKVSKKDAELIFEYRYSRKFKGGKRH
jgi:hypothetical protein